MSDLHLNTFAILILTKDRETDSSRYEYYHETSDLLNENRALLAERALERTANSEYSRYAYPQEPDAEISDDLIYWIKMENGKAYVIATYNIISDEDIESMHIIGPFISKDDLEYHLSQMNLETA